MASTHVTIRWQMEDDPGKPIKRENLLSAAYVTAMRVDPDVAIINIRADPHSYTSFGGHWKTVDPHITLGLKNQLQVASGRHLTVHGNTNGEKLPYEVVEIEVFKEKVDTAFSRSLGKIAWRPDKPVEQVLRSYLEELAQKYQSINPNDIPVVHK